MLSVLERPSLHRQAANGWAGRLLLEVIEFAGLPDYGLVHHGAQLADFGMDRVAAIIGVLDVGTEKAGWRIL
jgi:hypothetical protein